MRYPLFLNSPPIISTHPNTKPLKDALFSIIIPSWNNLPFLKNCIASLNKNSRYQHQIIIHLNENSDGSREWVENNNLDYTCSEENIGICYAMNIARTLATTNYLVYFNDDMYACPDWDFWLYEEIKKQDSIYFYLSATMIEPHHSRNNCVIAPADFGSHPDNFDEVGLLAKINDFEKADWQGTTWPPCLVPTLLWDMVGGYSTEFSPGMYSDPDFAMKLWQVGVRDFKGIGKSRVYHFMSKSTGKLTYKSNGSHIFLNKWDVSTRVFVNFYLRRGTKWTGKLTMPVLTGLLKWQLFLNQLKRRFS